MLASIRKNLLKLLKPRTVVEARALGEQFGADCTEPQLAAFMAGLAVQLHTRPEKELPLGKQTRHYVAAFAATVLATREARKARGG